MTSPLLSSENPACLQLAHQVSSNAVLDVYLQHQNMTGVTARTRLCSLTNDLSIWNSSYIYLPPGDYHLVFDAVVEGSSALVHIDNITLLNENCTKEICKITLTKLYNRPLVNPIIHCKRMIFSFQCVGAIHLQ